MQVKNEEQKRDPRIIEVIKTKQYQRFRNGCQIPLSPQKKPETKVSGFLFFQPATKVHFWMRNGKQETKDLKKPQGFICRFPLWDQRS